ncbi:MAG: hypothetical protein ACRD8Z_26995 [Nitrososphaeraceae archaeon]
MKTLKTRIEINSPEGEVLEFVPNQKISYTWEHKDIAGFSIDEDISKI